MTVHEKPPAAQKLDVQDPGERGLSVGSSKGGGGGWGGWDFKEGLTEVLLTRQNSDGLFVGDLSQGGGGRRVPCDRGGDARRKI